MIKNPSYKVLRQVLIQKNVNELLNISDYIYLKDSNPRKIDEWDLGLLFHMYEDTAQQSSATQYWASLWGIFLRNQGWRIIELPKNNGFVDQSELIKRWKKVTPLFINRLQLLCLMEYIELRIDFWTAGYDPNWAITFRITKNGINALRDAEYDIKRRRCENGGVVSGVEFIPPY